MSRRFEELDRQTTRLGEISLRRRYDPVVRADVYEVKLGEDFLMSSTFPVAEVELARLALAALPGAGLDVLVGGLGLGHTAHTVLLDDRVRRLVVVEALPEVIGWHERRLLPLSPALADDPRCSLVAGDFFAGVPGDGLPERWHAVVVDIDHSPRHVLHPSHAAAYTVAGLQRVAGLLHPGGVFSLWSDDPPDEEFLGALEEVFATSAAHVVPFANPYTGGESRNTVYVATTTG